MSIRDDVAAYHAAQKRFGASNPRTALSIEEAMTFVKATPEGELVHPAKVVSAMAAYEQLAAQPVPSNRNARHALDASVIRAEADFWDGFAGHPFAGGEIVRRQA